MLLTAFPGYSRAISLLRRFAIVQVGQAPALLGLDQAALTTQEARDLYHFRRKIEVFYRETKQTMEHDGVNSRTRSNCYLEMTWALLSIWFLKLMVVRQLIAAGKEPRKISVAKSRDLVRRVLRNGKLRGNRSFYRSLQECQTDNYRRTKPKASQHSPSSRHRKRLLLLSISGFLMD
jgi:hypothetical protein